MKPIVRSPVNQTGRKFKLIQQILPHFPEHDRFLDVFGGSGDVSGNNQHSTIFNDNCKPLVDWMKVLHEEPLDTILGKLDFLIEHYGLNSKNKNAYQLLKDNYNQNPTTYGFYLLHAHAYSNMIRMNSKGGWNLQFGGRTFNDTMRGNLKSFVQVWQQMDIEFHSKDFTELDYSIADFSYFDPPYMSGVAAYNSTWKPNHDKQLLDLLDSIESRWMLSNVFINNGKENQVLIDWSKKYRVLHIHADYSNSSAQRINLGKTDEVLICNY